MGYATALGIVPASAEPVPAAGSSQHNAFDPGNILSDEDFYDTTSMSESQVREFITAAGHSCSGASCLKDVRVTTQDRPADRYCSEYRGAVAEDAAAVLTKVSVACGISPRVMLVTLQKESNLLTATNPAESSYDAAFGWHCPDTGPGGTAACDPTYAGFFNQTYGMAKQWSRYRIDPQKYNYHAGETVDILWNVQESGCGSAPVTIANTATASLYNYTPYQPNAASLAGYPGPGDSCSSYGNRNFAFLYRQYFGSQVGTTTSTATASAASSISAASFVGTASATVTIPKNDFVVPAVAGRTITAPSPAVAQGLTAGFSALGLPYVWGGGGSGAGPSNGCGRGGGQYNSCGATVGFDCSGLTAFVLAQSGYRTPDNSGAQRSGGVAVPWSQALPGDIVGFPGHVAVYIGTFDGQRYILEASWVGTPVHVVPLTRTDVDAQVYRYWTGVGTAGARFFDLAGFSRTVSADEGTAVQPAPVQPALVEPVPAQPMPTQPAVIPPTADDVPVAPAPAAPSTTVPTPAAPSTTAPQPAAPTSTAPKPAPPTTTAPKPAPPTTTAPKPAPPTTTAPKPAPPATTAPTTNAPAPTEPTTSAPTSAPTTTEPTTTEPTTTAPAPAPAPAPTEPTTTEPTIEAPPAEAHPADPAPDSPEPSDPPASDPPPSDPPTPPSPDPEPIAPVIAVKETTEAPETESAPLTPPVEKIRSTDAVHPTDPDQLGG